ncbi:MAG: SPOR domain-containing protein [Nitrospirae bacterium]|jgi:cell division septation protein DedD|nr:SPOR domain-containing protein [Nitrospirota bacterium]
MRQEIKEKPSTIYIGKGIIISALIITASLGFTLGFFTGKSFRPNNSELSEISKNTTPENFLETAQPSSTNQQENNTTQVTEPLNSNSTTTNQQIQSSQTIQSDKGQIQTKTQPLTQEQQNNQNEKSKTSHSTNTESSNKNGKSKKYTVQVEAFKNQDAAEELKDKLSKKGYKVVVVLSDKRKNNKLYKVLVGEFSTRKEAEIMSIKIRKFEKLQHAFVTFKN